MPSRNVGGHGICLSILEDFHQMVWMCVGIERDELDQCVVGQNQTDQLGCPLLSQGTTLDFYLLIRPPVAQAQKFIEKVILNCAGNDECEYKREQRAWRTRREKLSGLVDVDAHYAKV